MESTANKPTKVLFCGSLTATLWTTPRVKGDKVVEVVSIKFDKSYEVEGQRKYTTTFYDEDLPKIALLAMEAYRFLKVRSMEPNESQEKE